MRFANADGGAVDQSVLAAARSAIGSDGDLPVEHRVALQTELRRADWRRWCRLELDCAERVLSIWRTVEPSTRPVELLALARRALEDSSLRRRLEEAADLFDAELQDAEVTADNDAAHAAGWAARQAAYAVVAGAPALGDRIPRDEDPWDWSAAFAGSIAWAGGATWPSFGRTGDPVRRRDYWRWYLDEAVPAALG